jgi:hypothetical protein
VERGKQVVEERKYRAAYPGLLEGKNRNIVIISVGYSMIAGWEAEKYGDGGRKTNMNMGSINDLRFHYPDLGFIR